MGSARRNRVTSRNGHLEALPFLIDFGTNYRGANVSGSFQIIGAGKLKRVKCYSEYRGKEEVLDDTTPPWLVLAKPWWTGQNGLAWSFRIDTKTPGFREASLNFEFGSGKSSVMIRATIKTGVATLGDLVVCNTPCTCHTDWQSIQTFSRFMTGLDFRVNHLTSIAGRRPRRPHTILLHGNGLIDAARDSLAAIARLADAGTNIVVLADKFFGATADAANAIGARYGMTLKPGNEVGYRNSEDLLRASNRYSEPAQICRHALTKGVRRMAWHRPWPIDCASKDAVALIHDSQDPRICYAAASKPKGYVVIVGKSLWSSFASVGWPYDNDRFLANLLVGGDAGAVADG